MRTGRLHAGIIKIAGAYTPGWMNNVGITLSSGRLKITDISGNALTPANPGWVTVPSTTGGLLVTLKVTTSLFFDDDAAVSSDLTNVGFGITETAHWAQDVPFFLYVVNRANSNIDGSDGSSTFFLARNPAMSSSPSAANSIGDIGGGPVTDAQTSILIMQDVTVANYTSLPCQLIGSIRMQWSTTTDDWTVQTFGNADGLGIEQIQKQLATKWTYPLGQNGAFSGGFMIDGGGTAPVFTTNSYFYSIDITGKVRHEIYLDGDGGTDGSGAVSTLLTLPYSYPGVGSVVMSAGWLSLVSVDYPLLISASSGNPYIGLYRWTQSAGNITSTITAVLHSAFGNGARSLSASFDMKAF